MSDTCYRCQGSTETIDNIADWSTLGASIQRITQRTSSTFIRVRMTRVRHREHAGPQPFVTDDTLPLCASCWADVMSFIGVGKRPENRMGAVR